MNKESVGKMGLPTVNDSVNATSSKACETTRRSNPVKDCAGVITAFDVICGQ